MHLLLHLGIQEIVVGASEQLLLRLLPEIFSLQKVRPHSILTRMVQQWGLGVYGASLYEHKENPGDPKSQTLS